MFDFTRRSLGGALSKVFAALAIVGFPRHGSGAQTSDGGASAEQLQASGSDDTAMLLRALEAASRGQPIRLGPGKFSFSAVGETFDGRSFVVTGAGAGATTVALGPDSFFIHANQPLEECMLEGVKFAGGRGAFRSAWSGVNVSGKKTFRNNIFVGYSESAIQNEGSDEPYWIIDNNVFDGANSVQTIGIALSRGCDSSIVTRNSFLRNRIHFKARNAGISTIVHDNEFLFFDKGSADRPRASIWLVPHDSWVNAGTGFVATLNKFGDENQAETDYRVLFAAEETGDAGNGAKMPQLTSASVGYADGHIFSHNKVSGAKSIPFIYSTIANLRNQTIFGNVFDGTPPSELFSFLALVAPDAFNSSNFVGFNSFGTAGINSPGPVMSFTPGVAVCADPFAVFETDPAAFHAYPGGGDATGFRLLLGSENRLWDPSSENRSIEDSLGRGDACSAELKLGRKIRLTEISPGVRPGEPAWIEFDIAKPSESGLKTLEVAVASDAEVVHWRRRLKAPETELGWRRFRFPFVFRQRIGSLYFDVSQDEAAAERICIGRVRIYHAREPVRFAEGAIEKLDFSYLPNSPTGLTSGHVWVDLDGGGVLRRV